MAAAIAKPYDMTTTDKHLYLFTNRFWRGGHLLSATRSAGIAFALATSKQEAIETLSQQYQQDQTQWAKIGQFNEKYWRLQDKYHNNTLTPIEAEEWAKLKDFDESKLHTEPEKWIHIRPINPSRFMPANCVASLDEFRKELESAPCEVIDVDSNFSYYLAGSK